MGRIPIGDAPRVLIVDDHSDIRTLLATALENDGYDVRQAGSADEGLTYLRGLFFNLVLTDYEMPGRTGAAMVQQAHLEGLLSRTPVVIVTAHPNVSELQGYEVWQKPVDLERFRLQIHRLVANSDERRVTPPADDSETELPRAEFALYVTRCSMASYHAQRAIERIQKWFVPRQLSIEVVCLEEEMDGPERDHVTLTPLLVRRLPLPKVWLVGDLKDDELLGDLIYTSGVDFDDDES